MNPIIIGYDGSESSRDALRLAVDLADQLAAKLIVASVIAGDEEEQATQPESAELERALADAQPLLGERDVALRRLPGDAAEALIELAKAEGAGLITIGSTHRGPLGRVFPGSLAEQLLGMELPCPIAVAPHDWARGEHLGLGLLGVGYHERYEDSHPALELGKRLAEQLDLELRVIDIEPGEGDPSELLAEESVGLDLLVLGSRGSGPQLGSVLGSVSGKLMRTAPCPVIVVRAGDAAAELG